MRATVVEAGCRSGGRHRRLCSKFWEESTPGHNRLERAPRGGTTGHSRGVRERDFWSRLAGRRRSGCHCVKLSAHVVSALTAHSVRHVAARIEATTWADNELVICTSAGRPPNPNNLHSREQQGLGASARARGHDP